MTKIFNHNKMLVLIVSLCAVLSTSAIAGDSKKGKKHYQSNCAQCHGTNGQPTLPRAANFTKKEGLRVSNKSLMSRIKKGGRACPAYSGILRDQEVLDLIAYLRTFR